MHDVCKDVRLSHWLPLYLSIHRIDIKSHSSTYSATESALHCSQVCWEKFNQYFEVEGRYVPVEVDYPVMSVDRIEEYADENTIGEPLARFVYMYAQRYVSRVQRRQDKTGSQPNAATFSDLKPPVCLFEDLSAILFA